MQQKSDDFHQKVFSWCTEMREGSTKETFFIGISAPQGAGKTTLTTRLLDLFREQGINAVGVSIDDFYLTHKEQVELAKQYPESPFLQKRGYPGTHDLQLGIDVLESLQKGLQTLIPRYNKSAFEGEGDRHEESQWSMVTQRQDIVILEGWMLGFQARDNVTAELRLVNQFLGAYQAWFNFIDAFIYLQAKDYNYLLEWRVEAEEKMKKQGLEGMSREGIQEYVKTFLPAFECYQKTPLEQRWESLLHLTLGRERLPLELL